MNRTRLNELKSRIRDNHRKASDLDVLIKQIMKLPYGQLKKVLTDDVLAVLAKYGYTEGAE